MNRIKPFVDCQTDATPDALTVGTHASTRDGPPKDT